MSNLTSTGAKFYIADATPVTEDQAGYEALTWVQVTGVTSIETFGATVQDITTDPLETGITEHDKGFRDYGEMSATCVNRPSDPGQVLLLDGSEGSKINDNFSYKVEYNDGSARYSQGQVYDSTETVGSSNQVIEMSFVCRLNKRITRVNV